MDGANMEIPFEQVFLKFYDRDFYEKFSPLSMQFDAQSAALTF